MATSTTNRKTGHHHSFVCKLIICTYIFWSMQSSPPWTLYIGLCLVVQYSLSVFHDNTKVWPVELHVYRYRWKWGYSSDVRGHISNHIWWSTLLFVHFYHILQQSIFHFPFGLLSLSVATTPIALKCLSKAGLVK